MFEYVDFDVETDGFLTDLTTIHSLVIEDLKSGEVLSCTDASEDYPSIEEGLEVLSKAKRFYGHNIIRFDIPAILKLYPDWKYDGDIIGSAYDTLIAVRVRFAHIKRSDFGRAKKGTLPTHLIGSQGQEAWGYRLGVAKTDYQKWCKENGIEEPFAEWRQEMQDYCEDDVKSNIALVKHLRKVGVPEEAYSADLELAWYLAQQERNGWPVDEEHLADYIATLSERKLELEETLIEHFGKWYEPKDDPEEGWAPKISNSRYGYVEGARCVRLEVKEFNPRSRDHIANRLQEVYGWEPKEFTPTGKPKVDESTLRGLDLPMADELNEYLLVKKRLGQVADGKQAWVKHLEGDRYQGGALTGMRHIHHSIGRVTVTHRHRHSHPNLGQVPRVGSPYGHESRRTFVVPEGWKLVGADADGLELRALAHYIGKYDGGKYGKEVIEGDIHTKHRLALGLPEETPNGLYNNGRDTTKSFGYAYLYGAGKEKLGSILRQDIKDTKKLRKIGKDHRKRLENNIAALGYLQKAVDRAASTRGYVLLPDNRRAYIRHKHAALNTLLQGAGSIIIKHWIVEINRRLVNMFGPGGPEILPFEFAKLAGGGWNHEWAAVGYIHDEVQIAAREEVAEDVAKATEEAMPVIADKFDWRLPLTASADIGDAWSDTH